MYSVEVEVLIAKKKKFKNKYTKLINEINEINDQK